MKIFGETEPIFSNGVCAYTLYLKGSMIIPIKVKIFGLEEKNNIFVCTMLTIRKTAIITTVQKWNQTTVPSSDVLVMRCFYVCV